MKKTEKEFRKMKRAGADFDEQGNLIGNVLTLRATDHKLISNGQTLYAWCALDTLFLPGLMAATALVESICPATGETIRLVVTPHSVESVAPRSAVLSVVVPGISAACESGQRGGAEGAVCSSMHFFVSGSDATSYLGEDTDLSILTVEEASILAQEVWVRPFLRVLERTL